MKKRNHRRIRKLLKRLGKKKLGLRKNFRAVKISLARIARCIARLRSVRNIRRSENFA